MPYSRYMELRSYNDDAGEFVSVSEDSDALGLVEIRQADDKGKITARITMTEEQAGQVAALLTEYLETTRKQAKEKVNEG